MTTLSLTDLETNKQLPAFNWSGYVDMVCDSIEQARHVMKSGGLSQPEVAKQLQSSRSVFATPGSDM